MNYTIKEARKVRVGDTLTMEDGSVHEAIKDAERTINRAECFLNNMGSFLTGRLRKVNTSILIKLKKEITHFNAKTGKWD